MMYHYWKTKGIRPSVFYTMPKGEQLMIRAFFELEIDERNENIKKGMICPAMLF